MYRLPKSNDCLHRKSLAGQDPSQHPHWSCEPRGSESTAATPVPTDSPRRFQRLTRTFLYKHPTLTAAALFLFILSGPPKFRVRDPEASLRADTDWVVILHIVIWGLAGFWVLIQLGERFRAKRPLLQFRLPQILGMAMILCLAASVWVSSAPSLTSFKVYQMLVSMLFTQIFTERYGPRASLKAMFCGNAVLCVAIAVCALWAPDVVWAHSDFDLGQSRLRGDLIASTGAVSAFAIILSFAEIRKLWSVFPLAMFSLFVGLLALSLMRTAYLVVAVFFALVLLRRPKMRPMRQFVYLMCLLMLTLYATNRMPQLNHYRDPETISTLSERTGLWRYLIDETISRSPWRGLGYYAASRTYGPHYNPGFGTAHSMFIEVLLGSGVVGFALLVALCILLSVYATRLLWLRKDLVSFLSSSVLIACLFLGFIGEELDSGPTAICFWYAVAVLPALYKLHANRLQLMREARVNASA
jgi:O-antigen ligase